jgi:general secretion pathway protein E
MTDVGHPNSGKSECVVLLLTKKSNAVEHWQEISLFFTKCKTMFVAMQARKMGVSVIDVIAFIDQLLAEAVQRNASDIHVEPHIDWLRIRQRVDGFLVQTEQLPPVYAAAVVSRLKVLSQLDIGERRLPQDGVLRVTVADISLDIRMSTLPTLHGEKVVLRLLRNRPEKYTFADLGMVTEEEQRIHRLLDRSSGLLVVTGPTGAGKTTTLYTILHRLNQIHANLVTLEDPIELQIAGINQVQIHPKAGLTFADGLRAVLRQDPNVIMVGEIRDDETARIAIQAALTGHLVLTTLHTVDAASVIIRLLDMGLEPYRVAAALQGVIAQRLVRRICPSCQGNQCDHCQQIGYKGRIGAFEVVSVDDALQQMIVRKALVLELRSYLRKIGVRSLRDTVLEQVNIGLTTFSEYVRVIDHVEQTQMEDESIYPL